jgi:hypothetical protein
MISNRDIWILLFVSVITTALALSISNNYTTTKSQLTQLLVANSGVHFDSIQTIRLSRDGTDLTFAKKDSQWWQLEPFRVKMDSVSLESLIYAVQAVQQLGIVSDSDDSSAVGLGDLANSISLSDGNTDIIIQLGRKTLGGRAYANVDSSGVVIVDQSLHRVAVDMDYRLWRDARLFPDFTVDGKRIERMFNGDTLVLDRTLGRWKMLEPVSTQIDKDILVEWIGRIAVAKVSSFVVDSPDNVALFGLENPLASFSVTDRNDVTHTLLIGSRVSAGSQDRFAMMEGRPVVYQVRWETLSPLFPAPEVFVDATGSSVSPFDIKQITIRTVDAEIVLIRNLEQWLNETGVPYDKEEVNTLLNWILETKPPSVSIGQYPRNAEIATITLEGYDKLPLDTVRVAQEPSGEGIIILENGDNVLRLHPPDSIEAITPFIR